MKTPSVFVIVPVYNVEKYLRACVTSLIEQSFTDWEAVLVDDGSEDASGRMCDELAAEDSRITVIHQENRGLAGARNSGMRVMRGEAAVFLDSDDIIPRNYLAALWETLGDSDVALAAIDVQKPDGHIDRIEIPWTETDLKGYLEAHICGHISPLLTLCCPNKMYRISVLKNSGLMQDEHLRRGEDTAFNTQLMKFLTKIRATNQTAYVYQQRGDSLMSRYVEQIVDAEEIELSQLEKTAELTGLMQQDGFRAQMYRYRGEAFFFSVRCVLNAHLSEADTAKRLQELAVRLKIRKEDIFEVKGNGNGWKLLVLCIRLNSRKALSVWFRLAEKRNWL